MQFKTIYIYSQNQSLKTHDQVKTPKLRYNPKFPKHSQKRSTTHPEAQQVRKDPYQKKYEYGNSNAHLYITISANTKPHANREYRGNDPTGNRLTKHRYSLHETLCPGLSRPKGTRLSGTQGRNLQYPYARDQSYAQTTPLRVHSYTLLRHVPGIR